MTLLSIFNNGSKLWILFIMMVAWAAYWGWKTYVSHKSGYHKQLPDGKYVDTKPPSLMGNGNFLMLVGGLILMTVFLILINGDYR